MWINGETVLQNVLKILLPFPVEGQNFDYFLAIFYVFKPDPENAMSNFPLLDILPIYTQVMCI